MLLRASVDERTRAEIARLSTRYAHLFEEICTDLSDLVEHRRLDRAIELSRATGEHLNHNEYPAYFFGDLDAAFVLVHLNPRQDNNAAPLFSGEPSIRQFEQYFDAFRRFGTHSYGPASTGEHKSPFDHKQIRFLRPFDVIQFTPDIRENLRRVVDDKLQLELVPYGSSTFSGHKFPVTSLQPHFERVMRAIAAHPRRYVIFCGSVFTKLLPTGSVVDEHSFHLQKKDGSKTKLSYTFATLQIPWDDAVIPAGLAPSWAQQGIPMDAYAAEIVSRYRALAHTTPKG